MRSLLITAIVMTSAIADSGWAGEKKLIPGRPTTCPEDHTFERSGMPQNASRLAKPSIETHEGYGYVGGGKLIHGDAAGPSDGTFGFDYQGFGRHPGRVFLGWAHDRKQPNSGPYRTDTHHVPDVVSFHPVRKVLDEHKEK